MKFTFFAVSAALVVCAAAQSSSTPPAPVTTEQACLASCYSNSAAKDLTNCMAKCLGNPYPSQEQTIKTTQCVAKCPTSDGSASGNVKYGQCVKQCVDDNYLSNSQSTPSTETSGPQQTGGSQQSGGSESQGPSPTGTTTKKNGTTQNTTTSPSSKPTGGSAASSVMVSISFAGTLAALAALLAL